MNDTIIAWATKTLNLVSGCSKPIETNTVTGKRFISPECVNCYAETLSLKRTWTAKPWTEPNEAANVRLRPERFREIGRLPVINPRLPPSERERIFICSMGDIFHRLVPDEFLHTLFDDWLIPYQHIYMLLTKRAERASQWQGPWAKHIWLGTSCGHKDTKFRIDHLRKSKATVRFVSAEPLLTSLMPLDLTGIDMVIVGGESGSNHRPMKMEWAREIRDACVEQGVAYFHKQDEHFMTEKRCYLVETDGTCKQYRQFPGELAAPIIVQPDSDRYHREHFPILKGA